MIRKPAYNGDYLRFRKILLYPGFTVDANVTNRRKAVGIHLLKKPNHPRKLLEFKIE